MVSIALYVEGGGDRREQKARLRRALTSFLEKAGLQGRMPRIVACGGRDKAYDKFTLAHANKTTSAMLLVDAEGPVKANSSWQHLLERKADCWSRPSGATDDQCHLMVQIMESWFIADRDVLNRFYGHKFRPDVIPQWQDIEKVPKEDVLDKLGRATSGPGKGAGYHKGRHGFEILGRLDPTKVADASPHAKRFIDSLKKLCA